LNHIKIVLTLFKIEGMRNDVWKKVIVCDYRIIMHELLKFNFVIKLTNISIPNHIVNDQHLWHAQSHYTLGTIVLFPWKKNTQLFKKVPKSKQTWHALQPNEMDHQVIASSLHQLFILIK
jgi:hypothetical protein